MSLRNSAGRPRRIDVCVVVAAMVDVEERSLAVAASWGMCASVQRATTWQHCALTLFPAAASHTIPGWPASPQQFSQSNLHKGAQAPPPQPRFAWGNPGDCGGADHPRELWTGVGSRETFRDMS